MKKNVHLMMLIGFLAVVSLSSCKKDNEQQLQNEIPSSVQKAIAPKESNGQININILLNRPITNSLLNNLQAYGLVKETFRQINALTMVTTTDNLSLIKRLSYIKDASEDAEVAGMRPMNFTPIPDFTEGVNMWNLDAVNVSDYNVSRTISENGEGAYIGVLDEGLPNSWRQYFPEDRIAVQYAKCFGANGTEQPGKWEHATDPHGLATTSVILGFRDFYLNDIKTGVAPKATIIPVKVSTQNNHYFISAVTRGIVYMGDLKAGVLANSPVIINMSLGWEDPIPIMQAAIDYAISKGVIVVANAGNEGELGMLYPGAYQNVISVGSVGWKDQYEPNLYIFWSQAANVADPTKVQDFYVSDFSGREREGQDLDVLAPGDEVVVPWEPNSGNWWYVYTTGTSTSSPHVAGIVALMAQKKPSLTAAEAESLLEAAAKPMGAGSATVLDYTLGYITKTWGTNATGAGLITADAALKMVK